MLVNILNDDYDFFAISETFLRGIDANDLIALDGYTFFRKDREEIEGGSIGVYVKSNYPVKVIVTSDPKYRNEAEFLILEIKINSYNLLFSVVYCRPGVKIPNELFNHVSKLLPSYNNHRRFQLDYGSKGDGL